MEVAYAASTIERIWGRSMHKSCRVRIKKHLGVTSIEYGLLAALIALAVVGALTATGTENGGIWDYWTGQAVAAFKSVTK